MDFFASICFCLFSMITGDEIYLVMMLLWAIWSELIKIRKSL